MRQEIHEVEQVCPACERGIQEKGHRVIAQRRVLCPYHVLLLWNMQDDEDVYIWVLAYWIRFLPE